MIELGDRFRLSLEPGETVRILSHRFVDDLDRDVAIEPFVVGAVHLTHPTLADLVDDAVVPKCAADEVLHCSDSRSAYVTAVLRLLRA